MAPVLDKVFIGYDKKTRWLNEHNLNKPPKFYLRYPDVILAASDNKRDSLYFLNFLNNHFTSFIDTFISGINNQNLTLQMYHKSTYTEVKF